MKIGPFSLAHALHLNMAKYDQEDLLLLEGERNETTLDVALRVLRAGGDR